MRMSKLWTREEDRLLCELVDKERRDNQLVKGGERITITNDGWRRIATGIAHRSWNGCRHRYYGRLKGGPGGRVAKGAWCHAEAMALKTETRAGSQWDYNSPTVESEVVLDGLYLSKDLEGLSPDYEYRIVVFTTTINGDALFRVSRIEVEMGPDNLSLLLQEARNG